MRWIGFLASLLAALAVGSPADSQIFVGGLSGNQRSPALEDSARSKDFHSLVLALGEDDQENAYYRVLHSGGGSPNSRFHMMLRDCRIAKLRAYIQVKPASEHAATAEHLFDSAIEAYDTCFKQQIGEIKVEKFDPFLSRHDAVLAMLLLCAEVCEPTSVLEKVDYLKSTIERHDRLQSLNPAFENAPILGAQRKPDCNFLKNLYLYFLAFQFPESAADPDLVFALAGIAQDNRREVPILYWDLKSNSISKAFALRDSCRLCPENEGTAHHDTDVLQEKRLRLIVDRYVAKAAERR
jgi:hypothetical protein